MDKRDDIYYWSNSQGLCVAAARPGHPGKTDFFGIICQSIHGKICFWDQPAGLTQGFPWNSSTNRLTVPNPAVVVTSTNASQIPTSGPRWVGGQDLTPGETGPCSSCHMGENAFITHPGTAVDLNPASEFRKPAVSIASNLWYPDNWPDPIVPRDTGANPPWPQNPGPMPLTGEPTGPCASCHAGSTATPKGGRFPVPYTPLGQYCEFVFNKAVKSDAFVSTPCVIGANPNDLFCLTGSMPVGTSNAYLNDKFSQHISDIDCNATETNLARGQSAMMSSDYTGLGNAVIAARATDGYSSANWADNTMFHTLSEGSTINNAFGGSWSTNTGVFQNSPGNMVGAGNLMYGMAAKSGGVGNVFLYDFSGARWVFTNGSVSEMSIGLNGVLWGVTSMGLYNYHPGDSFWALVSANGFTHVSAGDGVHPWVIDGTEKNVYRWNGTQFDLMYTSSARLTQIAVGSDEDPWVVDSAGNIFHRVGGQDFIKRNPPNGFVKSVAVANAYDVWITTDTTGIYNYNASTDSWQHHCPTGGCTVASSIFKSLSVGLQDHSVWALNSAGGIFQLDRTLAINRNSSVDDNSLASIPGVSGVTFTQIAAANGVFASDNNGVGYLLNNYAGNLPMSGGPWWYVDLGNTYRVKRVKIYNRDDGFAGRLGPFRVNFFTGMSWAVGADATNMTTSANNLAITFNVDFTARYVMVQKTNQDFLHLAEVEVYGSSVPVSLP